MWKALYESYTGELVIVIYRVELDIFTFTKTTGQKCTQVIRYLSIYTVCIINQSPATV